MTKLINIKLFICFVLAKVSCTILDEYSATNYPQYQSMKAPYNKKGGQGLQIVLMSLR